MVAWDLAYERNSKYLQEAEIFKKDRSDRSTREDWGKAEIPLVGCRYGIDIFWFTSGRFGGGLVPTDGWRSHTHRDTRARAHGCTNPFRLVSRGYCLIELHGRTC